MAKRPMITYPTRAVLGVIDDPATAARGRGSARGGRRPRDGHRRARSARTAGAQLATLGSRPNPLSRAIRVFQFMSMDQLPDFLVYERALEDGRAVLAVHVGNRTGCWTCARSSSGSTPTS